MASYKISTYPKRETLGTIQADGYEQAASKAARKFYKRAGAVRVTGDPGKSGIFAATRPDRKYGGTHLEERFHVM